MQPIKCIWIIDDDLYNREAFYNDAKELCPQAEVLCAESLFEAHTKKFGTPDVIVVDISAISPVMAGPEQSYSQICTTLCNHPNATVLINSFVGKYYAEDVRDLVLEQLPKASISIVDCSGCNPYAELRKIWRKLSPQ